MPKMHHEGVASRMARFQRKMLIDHIDGPRSAAVSPESKTRTILLKMKLLESCDENGRPQPGKRGPSTHTRLTEDGRQVLGWILAEYADALIACRCLSESIMLTGSLAPAIYPALTRRREDHRSIHDGATDEPLPMRPPDALEPA